MRMTRDKTAMPITMGYWEHPGIQSTLSFSTISSLIYQFNSSVFLISSSYVFSPCQCSSFIFQCWFAARINLFSYSYIDYYINLIYCYISMSFYWNSEVAIYMICRNSFSLVYIGFTLFGQRVGIDGVQILPLILETSGVPAVLSVSKDY